MISWNLVIFVAFLDYCKCSGYFEIQILSMSNVRGEVSDGTCCESQVDSRANRTCHGECDTFFRVCLKQYQAQVTLTGKCTFGNLSTPVLGGNTFRYVANVSTSTMQLPFHFSWTRSYTIIVTAWDRTWNIADSDRLIERSAHSGIILPGQSWHTLTHNGPTASLVYRIRVMCDQHYYNTTCSQFCRPHNDRLGHYLCNVNGDKVCMDGWLGTDCDIAICKTGCHGLHGSCDRPGECRCSFGWQGELCDQCIPYPGCQHGSCNNSPWTCNCNLNWGGILCNKDLNTCRKKPCHNHGLCMNTAPDNYTCACPSGYSGRNCEIVEDPCSSDPCSHGGTCLDTNAGYVCNCAPGWTGETCTVDVDECESYPCEHSGTCLDQMNGYQCLCLPGWQGPHCQLDADECEGRPCVNAHTCRDLVGDYHCDCQLGWSGKNCDFNINDCHGQCKNGGKCIDLIDDYYCLCLPGYEDKDCQSEIHECDSSPCLNGAACTNQIPGYLCQCAEGYSGYDCKIDIDPCSPNPCSHDATCYVMEEDYFCYCPESYTGKNCEQPKIITVNSVDSCTISIPTNNSVGGVQLKSSGICGKHGLCISKPGGAFECSCSTGFSGEFCHENINDCSSSPCQNYGTCVDLVNSYQCICGEGWEGTLCNINRNECDPNPCRNHGSCIDLVAGYVCQCVGGWKGKTCILRDSQCDLFTCANGGSCIDVGDTFACRCPAGWEGNTCHSPTERSCDSSPCQNNGTCVNSGDSFTCICREGFDGSTCQSNVNDCNPFPCYNGGQCKDGTNRYTCECPQGFSGPDCRVNINECFSDPCTYGSTCIDGIGEYRCICPLGRTGKRCEEVKGRAPAAQSCEFNRRTYHDNTTWEYDCNVCRCTDGHVSCTEVWCGPRNCAIYANSTFQPTTCSINETCVVQSNVTCFTPPCLPWGKCQPKEVMLITRSICSDNQHEFDINCARIILVFDKSKLPVGTSVEGVCISIKQLLISDPKINVSTISITCTMLRNHGDSIQIMMSTERSAPKDAYGLLKTVVNKVTEAISHKQTNSLALSAVIEVKVVTSIEEEESNTEKAFMLPLACSMIGLLGLLALVLVLLWHRRRQLDISRWKRASDLSHEKTNNENIDNLHNLRRYRNPLYETDKIVGTSNIRPMELSDVDKYPDIESDGNDRSPTRLLCQEDIMCGANGWSSNMPTGWSSKMPPKPKIKDINIELHKSRYRTYRKECVQIFPQIDLDENEVIV